jgi:uncharacterized membrane protein YsdA (DUF1294 family)
MQPYLVWTYFGLVVVLSVASFLAYGWDKRRAEQGGRRIAERTLHTLAFCGGWPGALLGQRHFRHKRQKLSFLVIFWALVALHIILITSLAYSLNRPAKFSRGAAVGSGSLFPGSIRASAW